MLQRDLVDFHGVPCDLITKDMKCFIEQTVYSDRHLKNLSNRAKFPLAFFVIGLYLITAFND